MSLTRVLIVDDDPIVRLGLRLLFRSIPELDIVGEAADGSEVIGLLEAMPVDAVLMDVRMRHVNGIVAARAIRQRFPDLRIVLMSSLLNEDFSEHARNIGSTAFVSKTASAETIRKAIIGSRTERADDPATPPSRLDALTPRELSVARAVAMGLSNDGVAQELHLSVNSVKTYVSRCLAKLGLENRVQLANEVSASQSTSGDALG
ncbi:LuxR family two component transcriptional regulator [Microbacterium sp. AG790]|uniref:response regulator transcription factor n=1 Tax=Microbacterium sp. AG790 TaxID=2183995 RepID=UPI000EB08D9A|nr:response regulator transcription factor [Microbacterium sp. AG790]RKS85702.1 LuxR family two component transcriptional regulator [Microbacterium sp. AG790]